MMSNLIDDFGYFQRQFRSMLEVFNAFVPESLSTIKFLSKGCLFQSMSWSHHFHKFCSPNQLLSVMFIKFHPLLNSGGLLKILAFG